MQILNASKIYKTYVTLEVLRGANLTINEFDRVGIVGLNGCGKTTLLEILTGKKSADSGDIYIRKNTNIGYLKQITDTSELTAYEFCEQNFSNLFYIERRIKELERLMSGDFEPSTLKEYGELMEEFEKQDGYAVSSKIKGVLNGLILPPERLMSSLSGGEREKLAIANLMLSNPEILILDEPTNHLDLQAVAWMEKYLSSYSGSIIIVSHDRYFMDKICNKIVYMENGKTFTYKGNYSHTQKLRLAEYEASLKQYEIQQKEIKRQKDIIREFYNRDTELQIKKAKSRQKMLDKMEVIERPSIVRRNFNFNLETGYTGGNDIIIAESISKSFEKKSILSSLDFYMKKGDKIGLVGSNGAGKSTFIKIIMDELAIDSGTLKIGKGISMGYISQNQETLDPENTILEEIHDLKPMLNISDVKGLLGAFSFKSELSRQIKNLSGGEKARLAMLKLSLKPSNFLLLDEPTNHLDINTKEILEGALKKYEGSFIAISHDRYFLNSVCNVIGCLKDGKIIKYSGNYDAYIEQIERDENNSEPTNITNTITRTKQKEIARKEREEIKRIKEEKTAQKALEAQIEINELKIEELEQELCKPEVFSDHELSLEIAQTLEKLKDTTEKLYKSYN